MLRRIAVAQAALDADEAHWLRVADEQNVWPALGYVHALEYLEDVFGYAPKTAQERMRVARELGALPQLEDALRCGEMSHSVVRELTRVATLATVERWMDEVRGRRLRDVERMVSGRKKGDGPEAPADPARVKHRVVLELDGESIAIWRQMQQVVEVELDHKLDDRALVLAIGDRVLREGAGSEETEQTNGEGAKKSKSLLKRNRYLIHLITCRDCGRVEQDGGGVRFAVDRKVLERAECDALICDDERGKRAKRTVPGPTERLVLQRARHRCEVPGCRASKHLTLHHIVFRSRGGTHDPSNLIVLCDGHHRVLHDGMLRITGRAPDELTFERNGVPLRAAGDVGELLRDSKARVVGGARNDNGASRAGGRSTHAVRRHTQGPSKPIAHAPGVCDEDHAALAQAALCQLGFKAAEAGRAVELASAHVGVEAELGVLIKEALRQLAPR